MSLPGFDSIYLTQICVGDSAGALCLQEAPWTWCHPTPPRRDGIWHTAGHRVQLLARTWPLVNCSWAAPACAHSSTSSQHGRAGGLMMMLPNPSPRLKPRSSTVGIPLVHGGHPEGTSSLVITLWCAAGHGVPAEPQATARATAMPAHQGQAHHLITQGCESSAALKGWLLAINHL